MTHDVRPPGDGVPEPGLSPAAATARVPCGGAGGLEVKPCDVAPVWSVADGQVLLALVAATACLALAGRRLLMPALRD
ncbi:MAG: hypothetical protein GC199_03495 [Alphaproteobacteria bacterium]|nr:hypothetical protein [Alphaproteobacteria bacterium]